MVVIVSVTRVIVRGMEEGAVKMTEAETLGRALLTDYEIDLLRSKVVE